MGGKLDPLSPVAPARVRVLLLPIGRITRASFLDVVARLESESVVRLGDVSPDGRPNRNMFSPLAFPAGLLLYDLSTSLPPDGHRSLSPFELFRQPSVVLGIADSNAWWPSRKQAEVLEDAGRHSKGGSAIDDLALGDIEHQLEELRDQFPKALVHQLILFNYVRATSDKEVPDGTIFVPPAKHCTTTTIKTLMCDITSLLLAEMTTFAKSLQGLPTIESPKAHGNRSAMDTTWNTDQPERATRPPLNSTALSQGARRGSSVTNEDKAHHRMSMPVHLPSSASARSSTGPRPSSPPARTQTPPPKAVEEINLTSPGGSPATNTVSRSSAASTARDSSRERVSVHGFGPGSLSERARNKGKGRVGIVIGAMYLQGGRWGDAVRELVENTGAAKANSDHLWHAKGLELILVSLLMQAWANVDFQIPQICFPTAEKSSSGKIIHHTPSNSTTDLSAAKGANALNRFASLQSLVTVLPDLIHTILNLYVRASNFSGENLPHIAWSQCVLRLSKLLTVLHLCGGHLDDNALNHFVRNTTLSLQSGRASSNMSKALSKTEITSLLFRAFPPPVSVADLSVVDRSVTLAGIASVLSRLDLHRKKALVLRELVMALVPGLVQARKVGAAEMGVHPAAGLSAMTAIGVGGQGAGAFDLGEGDLENGIEELLGALGAVYGVVSLRSPGKEEQQVHAASSNTSDVVTDGEFTDHDSDRATISRILDHTALRCFGNRALKLDVLRYCINLCEALPDFHGVLRFTSELLRTAGRGLTLESYDDEDSTPLSPGEQVRLATNISRTVGAARKLGLHDIEAEYWDDFLVRGVEALDSATPRTVTPHSKTELEVAEAIEEKKEKNPFIYNPFLKKGVTAKERLLVAREPADFAVKLQNPYDFEIHVEWLKLQSSGIVFECAEHSTIVGPSRIYTVLVTGTPKSAGSMTVEGCIVKINGCRQRRFPIFSVAWSPDTQSRLKQMGLAAASRPEPYEASSSKKSAILSAPQAAAIKFNVIGPQPILAVESTTLSQSAIMLLEGETKNFYVTLRNTSKYTPVDLLLFSFHDSTTAGLQAATSNKNVSPTDLYEVEFQLSHKQAFRWRRQSAAEEPYIDPGKSASFEIEVLGKPGLTSGTVQIDYSYLGVPRSEVQDRFYTRQIVLPVMVTVNASVELARADLLPLSTDFVKSNVITNVKVNGAAHANDEQDARMLYGGQTQHAKSIMKMFGLDPDADYCLLLLDLRNTWPNVLDVTFQVMEPSDKSNSPSPPPSSPTKDSSKTISDVYTFTDAIQPGHTSRIILPLPRIFLANPHAPVPALNPAKQRQFVVGSSNSSPEAERTSREAFWFRDEILKRLQATWEETGTGRRGAVDLRSIRLSPRMVQLAKVPDVDIDLSIIASGDEDFDCRIRHVKKSTYDVPIDEFLTVEIRVRNRTTTPIYPLLRLQPSLRHQPHNVALDMSKRMVWDGVLQRSLPELAPGDESSTELVICALCTGEFEIGASVEEIKLWDDESEVKQGLMVDDRVLTDRTRRTWYPEEAFVLVALDE
ncbi:MAG: hypothetical protein M1833_001381 [Piccolia ochrophora]|nr:MAG: hypothetical protein M1833_001381 [Piccolia ochrophora]